MRRIIFFSLLVVLLIACESNPQLTTSFIPPPTSTPFIFPTSTPAVWRTPSPAPTPTRRPLPTLTPTPIEQLVVTPTRVTIPPTPDAAIERLLEMLEGCGGLSEYEMQKIYWSIVVAQDEAERQARAENRRTVDYALADLAVMTYFSITARTLECIKTKGSEEMWPIPSRP